MAYRDDKDIEFLGDMNSLDLNDLVYILTHDKDGNERYTEQLTASNLYKIHKPNHNKYWQYIAAEVQCFGANSVATLFRGGKGVLYREVLTDVCDKLKVNYNKDSSVQIIENNLLMKILSESLENMSAEELKDFGAALGIDNVNKFTPETVLAIFQAVFRAGGFKSYQYTLIIVNAILKSIIGSGLSFASNRVLVQTMSILTGPIGWTITGLWTALDIASPAYRVTIPAVIQIAALRQKSLYGSSDEL
jgi:uncharacterized protein YaaW (UPF0174 family)